MNELAKFTFTPMDKAPDPDLGTARIPVDRYVDLVGLKKGVILNVTDGSNAHLIAVDRSGIKKGLAEQSATLLLTASAPGETLALDASAEAAEYAIDGAHSSIMFHIVHMDVAPFYGRFNKVSGELGTASG